jgi:membrane fusion protein (multidrug efflux system)
MEDVGAGVKAARGCAPVWLALPWALLATGCEKAEPPAPPVLEVVVASVVQQDVPIYGEWVGTTEGFVNAQIRPQVEGYLLKRHYREGSVVEQGDLLFEIDPRQFRAILDQARGSLGEAQAGLGKATLDVDRYTALIVDGAVSQQELDDATQAKLRSQASVLKARAEVEQARLNLEWTKIESRKARSGTWWLRTRSSRPSRSSTPSRCRFRSASRSTSSSGAGPATQIRAKSGENRGASS